MLPFEGGSLQYAHKETLEKNPFWMDVLTSWTKFTQAHTPMTADDVLLNTLWHNVKIKVGKKCIYYKHWASAGVNYIFDLFDGNGKFLSFNDFRSKFNIRTNFLEYGGVVRAIKIAFPELLDFEKCIIIFPFISNKIKHQLILKWSRLIVYG